MHSSNIPSAPQPPQICFLDSRGTSAYFRSSTQQRFSKDVNNHLKTYKQLPTCFFAPAALEDAGGNRAKARNQLPQANDQAGGGQRVDRLLPRSSLDCARRSIKSNN